MKKFFGIVLVLMVFTAIGAKAEDVCKPCSTWVKLSILPPLSVPDKANVYGLDLSIISSIVTEVRGVQIAPVYGQCNSKVSGVQIGLINKTSALAGVQLGPVHLADVAKGMQLGIINTATSVKGLQIGVINVTGDMQGIQVGLVNIIKNSKLPFMIVANAKFE